MKNVQLGITVNITEHLKKHITLASRNPGWVYDGITMKFGLSVVWFC